MMVVIFQQLKRSYQFEPSDKAAAVQSATVFFNLFSAAEPFANVCVAHGTLRNDPSVYATFCHEPHG